MENLNLLGQLSAPVAVGSGVLLGIALLSSRQLLTVVHFLFCIQVPRKAVSLLCLFWLGCEHLKRKPICFIVRLWIIFRCDVPLYLLEKSQKLIVLLWCHKSQIMAAMPNDPSSPTREKKP